MKTIPEGTRAVLLKNGSVYHPVWPHPEKAGWWLGTMVAQATSPDTRLVGGNYMFPPQRVSLCMSQNRYEIFKLQLAAEAAKKAEAQDVPSPTND